MEYLETIFITSWLYKFMGVATEVQGLGLALSKGRNRVGVFSTPEDRNRTTFQNVVFYSYLKFRTVVYH
jgi:hypothetical protein